MAFALQHFMVEGLHGVRGIEASFVDNKLVLVGENGTGKSTFAKLLFYTLTRQWRKLHQYAFQRLTVTIDHEELTIVPAQIDAYLEHRSRLQHLTPRYRYRHADLSEDAQDELIFATLVDELGHHDARQYMLKFSGEESADAANFTKIGESIERLIDAQVIFLPTYRRIEQDLKAIFPGLESDVAKYRERQSTRSAKRYIELVEFGMEDVQKMFSKIMDEAKDFARAGLSNLMGAYLRDVIRDYPSADIDSVRQIDTDTLTAMIGRIDEATLPTTDKRSLLSKVAQIKSGAANRVYGHDSVVAHFLLKVYSLYREQQAKERSVRDFMRVCNRYLAGKRLVFDDHNFVIFIEADFEPALPESKKIDGRKLELKMLSSGEKQIVSLFAHIYFSDTPAFFIIIDEPELSLSVEWQRTFLPDIIRTDKCSGLIAATHSPFIWQNHLESYVHSLAEFVTGVHVSY